MSYKYEIESHLGTLSHDGDYTKQVNLISWGDRKAVIDIRKWSGDRPLKGITLTKEEAAELIALLTEAI